MRKSLSAARGWQRLGALLLSAMVVASAAPASAAETFRGRDPESYECSSDYQILNRFSAPPGAPNYSTKFSDIKFKRENNVISVQDVSNSKDLAYIVVGENSKFCVFKNILTQDYRKIEGIREQCQIKYFKFNTRIVIDTQLPVQPFRAPRLQDEFDRMDHFVDVHAYRPVDWKARDSAAKARCFEPDGNPDIPYLRFRSLYEMTREKSGVLITEESPSKLREGDTYSAYEREALMKAGPGLPRPK
ncbi:hypothetical protein [Methylocystis rosea]|uniref:Uncharacterized protein n=1 Tax=Methylocystis rosea TaxID=173366 RepID=A0A3G8M5S4_9HYPH|nr:hypothetical protein [Methylocystis rosea]AZG77323.1 hypothetical protein EHO51_11585 [Methylocystis rosea]